MCGIAGIYHYGRTEPVSSDVLIHMRDTLRHRGPDDAGSWINAEKSVGLAHRRLSIVDLSANGRQPLPNEEQTVHAVVNGEIYNHSGLREGLLRRGHRFRSASDSEVIVHLYEECGPACVEQLDGMFAIAVWDQARRQLFLARDRLGVKPLYYTCVGGRLLFASEIKALLAHSMVERDVDVAGMYHYLTFKTTPAPRTMFAGICKLPAGHYLTCDAQGNIRTVRYWDLADLPPSDNEALDVEGAAAAVRALLQQAVAKRAVADVPTGVFLSGGLDSSAIVALLASQSPRPVNTFSAGIKDVTAGDELGYARQVARRFGANHEEVLIGRKDVEEYLPALVEAQDEPLADPVCVPLYYLARRARESGVVVVQVGEGSDEQFLGYDSRLHFLQSYARRWRPLMKLPRSLLRALHAGAWAFHGATGRGERFRLALRKAARGEELFWGSVAFGEEAKSQLLNGHPGFSGLRSDSVLTETMRDFRTRRPSRDIAAEVSYLDLRLRLPELLLMRLDKATMSMGVEAREPFLDQRLVEFVLRLPEQVKLPGGEPKGLLKRALGDLLPAEIVRRPKQAFQAPVRDWLRDGLGAFARRVLLESGLRRRGFFRYEAIEALLDDHIAGRRDAEVRIWTLMNLSAWYNHWIENATTRSADPQEAATR